MSSAQPRYEGWLQRRSVPAAGGLLVLLVLTLLHTGPARAGQHRFAVVVGVNDGAHGEERLRYAERDAVRMANILTRLGGVAAEDLVLMRGADAGAVRRAMRDLGARIVRRRAEAPRIEPVVFIYYSGHAGPDHLHLRGTRLAFTELKALREKLGAAISVVIVDSCHSGGVARLKGGHSAEPFDFDVDDQLQSRGVAILSSSAGGEDAQESDRLRGGVFTHHLATGLLGAADGDRDGVVALSEAWRYAHAGTVRTTSRSRFVQHPTFALELTGNRELIMTRLRDRSDLGQLILERPGDYVVFGRGGGSRGRPGRGAVVAEVLAQSRTSVRLPPGSYRVRRRGARVVHESTVQLMRGKKTGTEPMTALPYGRTVRKGLATARRTLWSLQLGGEVGGPLLPELSVGAGVGLGVQLDLAPIALQLRVRWVRATAENALLTLRQDQLGVDLGVLKVFDLPGTELGIGLGLRAGGDQIWQTWETVGSAPGRDQWVWRFGPVVRLELPVHEHLGLVLDAGADVHLVNRAPGPDQSGGVQPRIVPFGTLGITVWLP